MSTPTSSASLSLRSLETELALAVTTSRDAAPCAWSGHRDGRLRAWQDGRVIREVRVEEPFVGLDIGARELATWSGANVTLHAWPPEGDQLGAPLARWKLAARCERAFCVGPGELELYTVETDGHPYDRVGHRHRTRVGAPAGPSLAIAWGEPPPFGAEGTQPQRAPSETQLFDGLDGRLVLHAPHGETAHVVATPRAHGGPRADVRLAVDAARPVGATFARQPDGALDVLVWDLDRLWWYRSDGALLASVEAPDVQAVAALGDVALVHTYRGLAWLVLARATQS